MAPLLQSTRRFELWSARVGHRQLLLRSIKNGDDGTRIDVLFKPVSALKLRTSLNGLTVREATGEERATIALDVGRWQEDHVAFVIGSGNFEGYVGCRRVRLP